MELEEEIEAENFILRMLESTVHCDDSGGIKSEYLIDRLEVYMDWNEEQCMDVLNRLEDEGCIFIDADYMNLNFSFLYPDNCEEYPTECSSVMFAKHRNKCIENSLKIKEDRLTFLKSLEENTLRKIIDQMLGIIDERETTPKLKLEYPTKHLQGYNKLSLATGIIGREYRVIKKAMWYSILSTKSLNMNFDWEGSKPMVDFQFLLC